MAHPVAIGDYESQVPVEEGLRRIIPTRIGVSAGPGLEALGEGAQRLAQSEAANYSLQALSKAQSEWTQQFHDRSLNAQPGAPNFTPQLMGDYDKYVKDTVKGAPNQMTGRYLQNRLTEFGNNLAQQSLSFEAGAKNAHNEEVAKQSADMTAVELQGNPSVYPQRLAERLSAIDSMQMEPQVKEKLADYTKQTLSHFSVMGDINRDPYKAMLKLNDPKAQGYYQNLTAEQRQSLMTHADEMLHQRVADAERVHQLAKQKQEDNSNALLKQGIVMSQGGKLTAGWVIGHSSSLDPSAMKYLLDEAAGKKTDSDIHTYVDLQTRAAHGEDVTADATEALYKGNLNKEDWTKISDMGAKVQPSWFKRGTEYITTMSGYSEVNPNVESAQMKGRMIDQWQDWATEHPKATMKEAQSAYQDIVMHNMLVKMAGLPPLKYGVPGKAGMLQPDIAATKQRTIKAFKDGELSREAFNRQAFIIQQYERSTAVTGQPSSGAK